MIVTELSHGETRFEDSYVSGEHRKTVAIGVQRPITHTHVNLMLTECLKDNAKRVTRVVGNVTLTRAEARRLALAICPELAPKEQA